MLEGTRPACVKHIQPVAIHGQVSLDVYLVDPAEPQGQITLARLGPEAIPKNLEAGDRVIAHYVLGLITGLEREP